MCSNSLHHCCIMFLFSHPPSSVLGLFLSLLYYSFRSRICSFVRYVENDTSDIDRDGKRYRVGKLHVSAYDDVHVRRTTCLRKISIVMKYNMRTIRLQRCAMVRICMQCARPRLHHS